MRIEAPALTVLGSAVAAGEGVAIGTTLLIAETNLVPFGKKVPGTFAHEAGISTTIARYQVPKLEMEPGTSIKGMRDIRAWGASLRAVRARGFGLNYTSFA